jgi:ferredoxin-NADP reductase
VLTLQIRDSVQATPRAHIIRLDLQGQSFPYLAGQAAYLQPQGTEKRRPYSIASAPEETAQHGLIEFLVQTGPDGSSGLAADRVRPGTPVAIEGPLGSFTFPAHPRERRFVFIAGGTGIAPLRAMLRHALAIPHRDIGLFYSARTPEDFAFEREFRGLADAGDIELRQTVTRAAETDWTGPRGRLKRDALEELVHDPATLCFVCGPPALVHEIPKILQELGIPRTRIRIEEWGPPAST